MCKAMVTNKNSAIGGASVTPKSITDRVSFRGGSGTRPLLIYSRPPLSEIVVLLFLDLTLSSSPQNYRFAPSWNDF